MVDRSLKICAPVSLWFRSIKEVPETNLDKTNSYLDAVYGDNNNKCNLYTAIKFKTYTQRC